METDEVKENADEQDEKDKQDERSELNDWDEHNEWDEQDKQNEWEDQDNLDNQADQEDETLNQKGNDSDVEFNDDENHQESQSNASSKSSKQNKLVSRSISPKTQQLYHPQTKQSWKSANAFINFVQNFRKDHPDIVMGRNIFQICGEKWKSMSEEQKQPYIEAANSVKKSKHRKHSVPCDQQLVKKSVSRVSKRKAETKRKETSQKRTKVTNVLIIFNFFYVRQLSKMHRAIWILI